MYNAKLSFYLDLIKDQEIVVEGIIDNLPEKGQNLVIKSKNQDVIDFGEIEALKNYESYSIISASSQIYYLEYYKRLKLIV